MLKKSKWIFVVLIAGCFIAGCAHRPIVDKSSGRKIAAEQQKSIFELSPSDTDIIDEALSFLNNQKGEPDYNAARIRLAILIEEYPQSKWAGSAKALIMTINNLLALREKAKIQTLALDKENAEKAKLRKACQYSEERDRAEISRLQQENDQLKQDIALLKKLEIQLDKREKMLK